MEIIYADLPTAFQCSENPLNNLFNYLIGILMLCRFANLKSSLKHVYLFLKYTYFLLYNRGKHIAFHSCECNIPDMAHLWHKARMPVTVVWHLCFTSQLKRYMFRAIWEFAQSWDCAAHSHNLEIAFQSSQSRDCVTRACNLKIAWFACEI